jgi:hypothetical protein
MKLNSYLLAGAAIITLGLAANTAMAETIYTSVAPSTAVVTTNGKQEVVNKSYTAVGTRKVGLVGYHPYPMVRSHVSTSSVTTSEPETVVYTNTAGGPIETSTSVTTTNSRTPISYSSGGGAYYTENGTPYYRDPALNVSVRSTGSFND